MKGRGECSASETKALTIHKADCNSPQSCTSE
jgi:hypothetical protein